MADNGHRALTEAGICHQVDNILQTAAFLVNCIFAFTAAENAARQAYLLKIERQCSVAVIKINGDLCYAQRSALAAAGEDNILHFAATQILCALLAQHPTDGIRNIALARTVRSDNSSNSLVKGQFSFISKGFKAIG